MSNQSGVHTAILAPPFVEGALTYIVLT